MRITCLMLMVLSILFMTLLINAVAVSATETSKFSLIVSYTAHLQFTDRKPHSIEVEAAMISNVLLHPYMHLYVIYDSETKKKCSDFRQALGKLARGVRLRNASTVWSEESENRLHCVDKNGGQPNYVDMLRYVSVLPTVTNTVLLANADVVLGENLEIASNLSIGAVLSFSITGFAPPESSSREIYDQIVHPENPNAHANSGVAVHCSMVDHSYDALMFRRPVHYISDEESKLFKVQSDGVEQFVYMNNLGAEHVVIRALIQLRICANGTVWNMCERVPLYHFHKTAKTHQSKNRVQDIPSLKKSLVDPIAMSNEYHKGSSCGSASIRGLHFTDFSTLEDALTGSPREQPYKLLDPLKNDTATPLASNYTIAESALKPKQINNIAIVMNIDIEEPKAAMTILGIAVSNPNASIFVLNSRGATEIHGHGSCAWLKHNLTMSGCPDECHKYDVCEFRPRLHPHMTLRIHCQEAAAHALTFTDSLKIAFHLLHMGDYRFIAIVNPKAHITEEVLKVMTSFDSTYQELGSFATFSLSTKIASIHDKPDPSCTNYYSSGGARYRDCVHNSLIGCPLSASNNPPLIAPFQALLLSQRAFVAGRLKHSNSSAIDLTPIERTQLRHFRNISSAATQHLLAVLKSAGFAKPVCT